MKSYQRLFLRKISSSSILEKSLNENKTTEVYLKKKR